MDSKVPPLITKKKIKNEAARAPKKKSSPKGRLKPSEDEELQNSDNRGGYKVGSAYQMHLHMGNSTQDPNVCRRPYPIHQEDKGM